jgi:nucleotide-binding universal stress UspA family protein
MLDLSQILAPTDFSEHSSHAIRYAAGLARQLGAKLVLLHVVSNEGLESISKAHVPPHPVDKVYEELIHEAREQYDACVTPEVRRPWRSRSWSARRPVSGDHPGRSGKGADLIVMATHGRTGLSHALMGSVTEGGPEGFLPGSLHPAGGSGDDCPRCMMRD